MVRRYIGSPSLELPGKPSVSGSFDDLVGLFEQWRRYDKLKRLGGLEVDDQLKFGRLLTGRSAGLVLTRPSPARETVRQLLDYLVSLLEQQLRHVHVKRLSGFEIDGKPEERRLLEWKIGRLSSFQNTIDEGGDAI